MDGYHLPAWAPRPRLRGERFGDVELQMAELSPSGLALLAGDLRVRGLVQGSCLERRAESLERAAGCFLDPGDPWRLAALEGLPPATGFSSEMITAAFERIFQPIRAEAILRIVGGATQEVFPLVAVVGAGNIPGVALPKLVLGLAAGAACLVKSASGEPLLAALFARALAEADGELADRLAVLWWRGDDAARTGGLAGADSLIAYGSDEAIAALERLGTPAFVGHGHRLSVALVRLEDERSSGELAAAAALDVALYDQLGCLSPQAIFVIGALDLRRRFSAALAAALEDLAVRLPRARISEAASAAIQRLRSETEWREIAGRDVRLHRSARGTEWTVIEKGAAAGLRPTPLHRTIAVQPIESAAALGAGLGGHLPRIESVGIGPWPDRELIAAVTRLGVPRVAPLGRMQSPDLEWRQGGRSPLAGIVRGVL